MLSLVNEQRSLIFWRIMFLFNFGENVHENDTMQREAYSRKEKIWVRS